MAPKPENLPLYFNRMVDTKQDILLIHSATGHNVAINHSGIPDQRFNEIPLTKTSPAKPYFAAVQGTELTAVRVSARSGDDPLTLTIAAGDGKAANAGAISPQQFADEPYRDPRLFGAQSISHQKRAAGHYVAQPTHRGDR